MQFSFEYMAGQVGIVDQIVGITNGLFRAAADGVHLVKITIFNFKDPKTEEYLKRIIELQASEYFWFSIAIVLLVILMFTLLCSRR